MNMPKHIAISASAGSGKTYQLAHRYISLLADSRKIHPEQICAMTFTRKASGEIFDSIIEHLFKAASSEDNAKKTAVEIKMPHLKQNDFLRILRLLLGNINKVQIKTLDSFIMGVAKLFPLELGIPVNFDLIETDNNATTIELRETVLNEVFNSDKSIQNDFINAFKEATYGKEEVNFYEILNNFIEKTGGTYRRLKNLSWGEKKIIFGDNLSWDLNISDCVKQGEKLIKWMDHQPADYFGKSISKSLHNLINYLGNYSYWDSKQVKTLFERLFENLNEFREGNGVLEYSKKDYKIPAEQSKLFYNLAGNVIQKEINNALIKTRGIYKLMKAYDSEYFKVTRSVGKFSFNDIHYLLAGVDISNDKNSLGSNRLYIDYRLDCTLDHWLIDEFQDTSNLQWNIFKNLIEEIIQAPPEYYRTFFCVGDSKQSIYQWRGGNYKLFDKVLNKFKDSNGKNKIKQIYLNKSRRCSKPVIETVNAVFSDLPKEIPSETVKRWHGDSNNTVWKEHEYLKDNMLGYTVLLEPETVEDKSSTQREKDIKKYQLISDLLMEINPKQHKLSVGILVIDNKTGQDIAGFLRNQCMDMSFIHEGKSGIIDNHIVRLLISLIKLAAHPGNELAWQHIKMSPLSKVLQYAEIKRSEIAPALLSEIEKKGFRNFIIAWSRRLNMKNTLTGYEWKCITDLETAASEFDETGSRNCNRFISFINKYKIDDRAGHETVRIMTVHQAKGLEFDIVILPELDRKKDKSIIEAPLDNIVDSENGWALKMPPRIIALKDPVLKNEIDIMDAELCFDKLCLLYVAMTRARYGLYMITEAKKATNKLYLSSFLRKQLFHNIEEKIEANIKINNSLYACLYSSGDRYWYKNDKFTVKKESNPVVKLSQKSSLNKNLFRKRMERYEPSKHDDFVKTADVLFNPEGVKILNFGSAIHEVFEKIEWFDDTVDIESIITEWKSASEYDEDVSRDMCIQFRKVMEKQEVRDLLAKPADNAIVWREKSFETILNDKLVSGTFDRVVITYNDKGMPENALIIDYKSNRNLYDENKIQEKIELYTPQMTTYREALAKILKIREDQIKLKLLFTVPAQVRDIL